MKPKLKVLAPASSTSPDDVSAALSLLRDALREWYRMHHIGATASAN